MRLAGGELGIVYHHGLSWSDASDTVMLFFLVDVKDTVNGLRNLGDCLICDDTLGALGWCSIVIPVMSIQLRYF